MPYTVAEAAAAIGKSKAAVFRAIRKGTLSAARAEAGGMFLIDPAELLRAFPPAPAVSADTHRDTDSDAPRRAELEGRLADAHDTIRDLRARLDTATAQLGEALQQMRLLTDQRAKAEPPTSAWGRFLAWRRG